MAKSNEWKKSKTIYWKDELHDDFDEVGLKRPEVPEGYKYKRTNPINNFFSGILYHCIAKPVIGFYCVVHGIKFKGKKNLKTLKGNGAFLYSNHVAISDVFKFQAMGFFFKRRVNILGYPDAMSMPIVRNIVRALGYLPVPSNSDLKNMIALTEACGFYYKKKQFILIYPEAHIWPYYTKIRNFSGGSFIYPAKYNAPVVPCVTVWRKPFIGKKPRQTVVIGEPIFPNPNFGTNENKNYLHEECLKAMKEISSSYEQVEYIKYIKKED